VLLSVCRPYILQRKSIEEVQAMGLKQRHRRLLLGLLVLGCVGLAHTTATGAAQWRGEGTIQAEYNGDNAFFPGEIFRGARNGVFTITFEVMTPELLLERFSSPSMEGVGQEQGISQEEDTEVLTSEEENQLSQEVAIMGEGTLTVTDTMEFNLPGQYLHCTGRLHATAPVFVAGVKEGSMLKLKLSDISTAASEKHTSPWSCTGPGAKFADPKMRHFSHFEDAWLEVAEEDGATGELVINSSPSMLPNLKEKEVWTIRIKAAPPPAPKLELASCPEGYLDPQHAIPMLLNLRSKAEELRRVT
jgi:hypothetical protein